MTGIGYNPFSTNTTSIYIPHSVTSFDEQAFINCESVTKISVASNNPVFKSIDGNLYSKDGKILIRYASGKQDNLFIIPDSVVDVSAYAFLRSRNLTTIVITDSVVNIGVSAFGQCVLLKSVTIPDRATLPNLHPQNNYCTL